MGFYILKKGLEMRFLDSTKKKDQKNRKPQPTQSSQNWRHRLSFMCSLL